MLPRSTHAGSGYIHHSAAYNSPVTMCDIRLRPIVVLSISSLWCELPGRLRLTWNVSGSLWPDTTDYPIGTRQHVIIRRGTSRYWSTATLLSLSSRAQQNQWLRVVCTTLPRHGIVLRYSESSWNSWWWASEKLSNFYKTDNLILYCKDGNYLNPSDELDINYSWLLVSALPAAVRYIGRV